MPSWIETKLEITRRSNDYDGVRRERILKVEEITGRPLIIYATDFLSREKVAASGGEVNIDAKDKVGFDEVTCNIQGSNLDILVHSPGGDAQATQSIVDLLHSRFSSLRFFVPDQAKSAATMMCCSGDEILMDERSELGPIDPQMLLIRADKVPTAAPAQAIIDQFDIAKKELSQSPDYLPAWLPILQPLAPALLTQCEAADKLSRELVESWLKHYMFRDREDSAYLAKRGTDYLADYKRHLSHGRRIGIQEMSELGFVVRDLRQTPDLRTAVWNLYLAISVTFDGTAAFKVIENGHGAAYIRSIILRSVQVPVGLTQQPPQNTKQPQKVKPPRRHR